VRRLPGVDLEGAALHQRDQRRQAVDGDQRLVAVVLRVVEGYDPGMLLKKALTLGAETAARPLSPFF